VAKVVGQTEVVVRGQFQQLLEAQHGQLAIGALPDEHRRLVVARHAGPQHLELRLRAGVETGLRLLQRGTGLIERGSGDRHETVGEQGVVVGLRGVEPQLRPRADQRLLGARAPESGELTLRPDAAPRVQVLRERQRRTPGVGTAERQVFESAATAVAAIGAAAEVDVVEDALEFVGERAVVGGRGRELRIERGLGPHLVASVALQRDPGDGHGFAPRLGDGQHLFERQRAGQGRRRRLWLWLWLWLRRRLCLSGNVSRHQRGHGHGQYEHDTSGTQRTENGMTAMGSHDGFSCGVTHFLRADGRWCS